MNFGDAIKAMKADPTRIFAREGWNGKGMSIGIQYPDEDSANTLPYVYIVTDDLDPDNPDAPSERIPWVASQTDMLTEDWVEADRWVLASQKGTGVDIR